MKNLILINNNLVILPYIKDISEIRIDINSEFYFDVESMVSKNITEVYDNQNDNKYDLGKYKLLLRLSFMNGQNEFYDNFDRISKGDAFNFSKEDCYNELKSKYDNLDDKRNKLLIEWDKILSTINRI